VSQACNAVTRWRRSGIADSPGCAPSGAGLAPANSSSGAFAKRIRLNPRRAARSRAREARSGLGPGPGLQRAVPGGDLARSAEGPGGEPRVVARRDDLAIIPAMLARYQDGADVVVASRYMAGGRQVGGPWLKAQLSRWGGLALGRRVSGPRCNQQLPSL
jgi:hypothetical protein